MKEDQDDFASSSNQPLSNFGSNPFAKNQQQKPAFEGFDSDEEAGYEEPDRDTDYALGFREETVDEDEAFENLLPEDLEEDDAIVFAEQEAFLETEVEAVAAAEAAELDQAWETEPVPELPAREWESDAEEPNWEEQATTAAAATAMWAEEDSFIEEEREQWPVSLVAVGALALLLVVAGVYGVMQQRSATQEEILELRASLATAASPEEVSVSRAALQETNAVNAELTSTIEGLKFENQRLVDTVAGLEAQLTAQESALKEATARKKAATTRPKPAPVTPAAAVGTPGDWFVNFGSYGQRTMAENWATRLKPANGSVVVAPSSRDGQTFYRVRIINLPGKEAANNVARQLESAYGVSRLWVGQQ